MSLFMMIVATLQQLQGKELLLYSCYAQEYLCRLDFKVPPLIR